MSGWNVKSVMNVIGARPLEDCGWAASVDAVIDQGQLHLSGWVLGSDKVIANIGLWGDDWVAKVRPDQTSPDIAQVYGHHPESSRARFALSVPLSLGTATLKIFTVHALPESGDGMHIATLICRRDQQAAPRIFVVGSPRSGTTAVGNALRHALGLPNYGESHVLPVLQSMIEDTDRRMAEPNTAHAAQQLAHMMAHLPTEELRERLGEVFRTMYRQLNHGDSFCDKTPGVAMLRTVPLAQWLWPDAKFVFCKRRGFDNIASRMRKFSQDDFEGHCIDWAMAMQVWLEVQGGIPESRRCEIDQADLLADPIGQGRALGRWCGLNDAQSDAVATYLATQSPERTDSGPSQPKALADLGWTEANIATFRRVCGPLMTRYGYSESSDYWLPATAPAAA